jgi:hypothetical protein
VSKNSKHWSNKKGPSSTTKIVQRNNSERSNVALDLSMHMDTNSSLCYCYCFINL